MKHNRRNYWKFSSQRKSLLFAVLIISTLLVSALGTIPGLTGSAAAIPNDTQLMAQGRATAACKNAAENDFSGGDTKGKIEACAKYYVKGYKDPNGSSKKGCEGSGASIGLCLSGYQKGQEDRKAADKAATTPAPTGNLSESQIRALGSSSAACAGYDKNGTDGDKALHGSCVNGYVAGYQGKPADWCEKNSPSPNTCSKGYAAGKSDKANGIKDQASQTTATTEEASSDESTEPGLDCKVSFNPLTWLLCPTVKGLVSIVGQVDNIITSQLSVGSAGNGDDPNQIFCTSGSKATLKTKSGEEVKSCDAYKEAWKSVRNIALGLMVIAGLIVLIAQALGTELLDAYTMRKVLPRLLIAAVAITLSWELMQFFVRLSNDLGFGVRYLIYAPFKNIQDATISGGGATALGLIEVGAILAMGIFGVLSFALTAALSVFVAFIVLVLRELIIIVLVIFAPIAIVAYILPNTQKMYKLWWDSFSRALLMFPIIAAFIASGRVFATVAGSSTSALGDLIAFAAYFAPYLLLPLTFSLAGGAVRAVGGFVNNGAGGGFKILKGYRGNSMKKRASERYQRADQSRLFNPNRKGRLGQFNRRANTVASALISPGGAAKIYGGAALSKMGVENSLGHGILNSIDQQKYDHSAKLAEKLNGLGFNDKALKKLMTMEDHSVGSIRKEAAILQASKNNNDRLAGQKLAAQASFLAQDIYADEEMGRADIHAAAGLALSAQGFADTNDIADVSNTILEKGSRGLAQQFNTNATLNSMRAGRVDAKPGYSSQVGEDGRFFGTGLRAGMSPMEERRAVGHQMNRLLTTSQQEFQGAKKQAIEALAPGIQQMLLTDEFGPDGYAKFEFRNERGQKEDVKFTESDRDRLAAMLGNARSDFSGTSASTSTAIGDVVKSLNLQPTHPVQVAYDRASRQEPDPREVAQPTEPPKPDGK